MKKNSLSFFGSVKPTMVLLIALAIFGACKDKKGEAERAQLIYDKTSLETDLQKRDSIINDMWGTFTDLSLEISAIKEKRNMVTLKALNSEKNDANYKKIIDDIKMLDNQLDIDRKRIAELSSKLAKSGVKIEELNKRIAGLEQELQLRSEEIASLKKKIEEKDLKISDLGYQIETLNTKVKEKEVVIGTQDVALNTAFYAMGSFKDLEKKGVITKEGGVLGMGKTKTMNDKVNQDLFEKIDIRNLDSLVINAKEAELVTVHPNGSYVFNMNKKMVRSLQIIDKAEFWKTSKYAVIAIKN